MTAESPDLAPTQDVPPLPAKEAILALPEFERLPVSAVELVASAAAVQCVRSVLLAATVLGFDTESKPTFQPGEVSDGPHVAQFALDDRALVLQLRDAATRALFVEVMQAAHVVKVGSGLGEDLRRFAVKFGVVSQGVVDINTLFRERGYSRDVGVRAGVALLFGKRFIKSRKASTSNWAARSLTSQQLVYAGNDAWAALQVYRKLVAK